MSTVEPYCTVSFFGGNKPPVVKVGDMLIPHVKSVTAEMGPRDVSFTLYITKSSDELDQLRKLVLAGTVRQLKTVSVLE